MKPNPVVHFEFPAEDKVRMCEFYSRVFGWHTQILGEEMNGYVLATAAESDETGKPKHPGNINGGFYQKTEDPMRQHMSVVISVDDIQESIKMVKDAGGTIHGEVQPIPTVGLFISFTDTEGNNLSMLQPEKGSM